MPWHSYCLVTPLNNFVDVVVKKIKYLASVAMWCVMASQSALAQSGFVSTTVTFEDIVVPAGSGNAGAEIFLGPLVNGYAGFRWGAFAPTGTPSGSMYATENKFSGNAYVATSGPGVGTIVRSDGADFYFESLDVFSRRAGDAVGDFSFVLYHDGQTVYNGNTEKNNVGRNVFTGTSQSFSAVVWGKDGNTNYTGPIDGIAFYFDNDDYDHMAFDNLKVRVSPLPTVAAPVPEPETLAMWLAGLGLMGFIGRRKLGSEAG